MQVKVDDDLIFTLSDIQKKVIKNDIHEEIFEKDMKRRIFYIINRKYEECFARLKKEWEPKLHAKNILTPPNKDEFAELVFSQPDYKNRSQRESKDKK